MSAPGANTSHLVLIGGEGRTYVLHTEPGSTTVVTIRHTRAAALVMVKNAGRLGEGEDREKDGWEMQPSASSTTSCG
ncbi:DUF4357 domain-containing protein [Caenorhabditis elegans]|uniref:DUF4357 domain-containing protein n=1 Tax=Caenorhabditis elegans TaxID=6239 RepID=Q4R146_CAEEL|nr:DUF4357 domain-containing protein [Caenorhabditis elegans]CCD72104.1 DUF4357 domain-containing protein [Caenorhabditis elegans]|eukprot:NP_001033492.1 Uncharacterized protein CELE_F59A7.12 [Caenorhabditis elegans]